VNSSVTTSSLLAAGLGRGAVMGDMAMDDMDDDRPRFMRRLDGVEDAYRAMMSLASRSRCSAGGSVPGGYALPAGLSNACASAYQICT
jgi:hypothetical protein